MTSHFPALYRPSGSGSSSSTPTLRPLLPTHPYAANDTAFQPVAEKTQGCALGTIYELRDTLQKWIGKVGQPKGFSENNLTDMNIDAIREKIAVDLYDSLSRGTYLTPATSLSTQKVMDPYSKTHYLAGHWNSQGIDMTLRIMVSWMDGYQDFTKAKTLAGKETLSFVDFLKRFHRPPETLLTPSGESVPLTGLMELLSTARLLADVDCLGGTADNAGWVWEKNAKGSIIAARAVKIDPGEAFQFVFPKEGTSSNRVLNTIDERGYSKGWLQDLKNLQAATNSLEVTIEWKHLTPSQQGQFLDHTVAMINHLLAAEEERLFCFYRDRAFKRSDVEMMPKSIARQFANEMESWLKVQQQIYGEGLKVREAFFYYPSPMSHFVGREGLLRILKEALVPTRFNPKAETAVRVLYSPGGMGKSELASSFAYQERKSYSLIYWISSDSPVALFNSYLKLAEILKVYLPDKGNFEQVRNSVHKALERREADLPWLLIFDNAEETLTLPQTGGSVLITAREAELWDEETLLQVSPLKTEEALLFLEQETGEARSKAMEAIVEKMECFPLALSQVAATMRQEKMTAVRYLQKIEAKGQERPLIEAWSMTLERVQKENPVAFRWLAITAFLHPDKIPEQWLESWLAEQGGEMSPSDVKTRAKEILSLLRGASLIRYDSQEECFSLHRLLQEALLSFAGEKKNRVAKEALQILEKRGEEFDEKKVETWEKGKAWEMHARFFLLQGKSLVSPSSGIPLWKIIGSIEYSRGRWAEAVLAYSRALELLQENAEESGLDLAQAFDNLARALGHAGRSREALEYAEKALAMKEKLFSGEPHPDLALSLGNMAQHLSRLGQTREALEYAEKALAMREKLFSGEPHPDLALSLGNMASCLSGLGQTREALEYDKKALAMKEKLFSGEPHPDLALSLNNMAVRLSELGQPQEALEYAKKALAMKEKLFSGEPHPSLASSLGNMAARLSRLGRAEEALEYEKKALAMKEKLFSGEPHPDLADSLGNMAVRLSRLGQTQEALEYEKKALAMREKLFSGEPHPDLALSLGNMASRLSELGQLQEALEYNKKALAMREKLFSGEPHPDLAKSLGNMGVYLSGLGRNQEALEYEEKALAMKEKLFSGEPHPDLARSLGNMAVYLSRLGQTQEALEYEEKALAMREKLFSGEPHPDLARSLGNMASRLSELGQLQEALEYNKKALVMREKLFSGEPHPKLALSLRNIAVSLETLGRYEEALKHYQNALAMRKKLFPDKSHPQIAQVEQDINDIKRILDKEEKLPDKNHPQTVQPAWQSVQTHSKKKEGQAEKNLNETSEKGKFKIGQQKRNNK